MKTTPTRAFASLRHAMRLALMGCVFAAPQVARTVEATVYLAPSPVPVAAGTMFEQIPSDAAPAFAWRTDIESALPGRPPWADAERGLTLRAPRQ